MQTERVILYPLPHKIRGFICTDGEGGEIIFLNSRLTNEANRETTIHEIKHLKNNDLYRQCHVGAVEIERHERV